MALNLYHLSNLKYNSWLCLICLHAHTVIRTTPHTYHVYLVKRHSYSCLSAIGYSNNFQVIMLAKGSATSDQVNSINEQAIYYTATLTCPFPR